MGVLPAQVGLAWVALTRDRPGEAEQAAQQAVAAAPDSAAARIALGLALMRQPGQLPVYLAYVGGTVFIEAYVLDRFLRLTYRPCLQNAFWANLLSYVLTAVLRGGLLQAFRR